MRQSSESGVEYREVFRNRSATDFAPVPLLATIFQLIVGLLFAALALSCVAFFGLALLHNLVGFDSFPGKGVFDDMPRGMNGIVVIFAGLLFTVLFFGGMAYWCLKAVERFFSARLYVLLGRPLDCVEGPAVFEPSSEYWFSGVEIGDFYFSFDHCWLSVDRAQLQELSPVGATLRVWYIPLGLRGWHNPQTGKFARYGCTLVRAERPV